MEADSTSSGQLEGLLGEWLNPTLQDENALPFLTMVANPSALPKPETTCFFCRRFSAPKCGDAASEERIIVPPLFLVSNSKRSDLVWTNPNALF